MDDAATRRPRTITLLRPRVNSLEEFAEAAFACAGLDWRDHIVIDPALLKTSRHNDREGEPIEGCSDWGGRLDTGCGTLCGRWCKRK